MLGTDGDDVMSGTPLDDIMCGFGGNDRLEGGAGDDTLVGGDGDDDLVGGEGTDCMVGGNGEDSADTTPGEAAEVEHSADGEPSNVGTDASGHCNSAVKPNQYQPPKGCCGVLLAVPRASSGVAISGPTAEEEAATADGVTGTTPATVELRLPSGDVTVRKGVIRLGVSCSSSATAELVIVADSQRIAHKRFTCERPGRKLRVRLNEPGRRLLASETHVEVELLLLSGGRTTFEHAVLVSRDG